MPCHATGGRGRLSVAHGEGYFIPPPAGGRAALFGAADSAAEASLFVCRSSMSAAGAAFIDRSFSLKAAEKQAMRAFL